MAVSLPSPGLALRLGTEWLSRSRLCPEAGASSWAQRHGEPLPASGELGCPEAPSSAASREQEPETEQRPSPRAAHAAPGAFRARPFPVAAPSLPTRPPARAASRPGRTEPGSQRCSRRAGGRRGRAHPASPSPSARPPPPAPPLPTRKEPRGARAPPSGGPPGVHLSSTPCALPRGSLWEAGCQLRGVLLRDIDWETEARATVLDAAGT
ncbi:hypothetical protein P7K49_002714 [Saguinus oedipus]|uniref:Uncharacterized protein n=1 Tax=Saguinus oedipus TaxID=9490 RepID=A0ABQ9WKS5_SAGOE|nr:hypothetical protein P7K49_002714 [Saguinus oedipus]